jgi:hypothetical protein
MFSVSRSWIVVIAASLAVACTACQSKPTEKPAGKPAEKEVVTPQPDVESSELPGPQPAGEAQPRPAAEAQRKPAAERPKPQDLPLPPSIPKVALSSAFRATCVVNVGDKMPEGQLSDPAGKMHALESLYGQKLTVVCFWALGTSRRARTVDVAGQHLHDLMKEVVEPFDTKGVRVVGINVGDTAAAVGQEVSRAGATFLNLVDSKGEFFAKIAKDKKTPRIYLLDAGGRILWFDVECSRSSRRDLVQNIRVALGEL